ncbi:MAG: response regulator [Steroidobacteraceae bacterium]
MARVLIVDDERDVRGVMARILERAGHEVEVADCGPAGMQAYQANGADVIITDVIMPGQNGVELIQQLRDAGFAGRIIAISGGGNLAAAGYTPGAITTTAYLAAAAKVGANAILTKPFDRQQLLDLISYVLAS